MDMSVATLRQHLIDPELCLRCNGCEETCSKQAISHDHRNYAIDVTLCDACMECVEQCPTGAVDRWQEVPAETAYSVEEQYSWIELPPPQLETAQDTGSSNQTHGSFAPASAATPTINLYQREAPATARIVVNQRITGADCDSDVHHIVLDLSGAAMPVLEGQSIGILPPGQDDSGAAHAMRVYSVASSRTGEGGLAGHVALTVKRVTQDASGQPVVGVCSNHLCDRPVGDTVSVVGPFGASFLMPQDPASKLILVATGTGIAPMRGMLARRQQMGLASPDSVMLFYGGRTPADMPYLTELQAQHGHALALHAACSRLPGQPRRYAQDAMAEAADQWFEWLTAGTGHAFVCGLKGVEAGVLTAMEQACLARGVDWGELHARIKAEHRLHIETY